MAESEKNDRGKRRKRQEYTISKIEDLLTYYFWLADGKLPPGMSNWAGKGFTSPFEAASTYKADLDSSIISLAPKNTTWTELCRIGEQELFVESKNKLSDRQKRIVEFYFEGQPSILSSWRPISILRLLQNFLNNG